MENRNTSYSLFTHHCIRVRHILCGLLVLISCFWSPSIWAQECTTDESILVKWDFESRDQDCNGIMTTRRRFWNPSVPLMTGGNTYCPQINDGSGQALIFERGFGNTNDFRGAMCIAGFWRNGGNKYFTAPGYDPNSPTYNPDNPSGNIFVSYSFLPGQAGQLTSFALDFIQSGWRSGQTIAFNSYGVSVSRNGVRIFETTIPITAANVNNPAAPLVINFPNSSEFRTDGATEVVWEIALAFVERNVIKRSGIDNICLQGTTGAASADVNPTPATCESGGTDGQLTIVGFSDGERFDFNAGTSYTGSATFATAMGIPADGIIANNLQLETMPTSYTVRIFREDCFIDETVVMPPVFCPFTCDFPSITATPNPPTCDNGVREDNATIVLTDIVNADRVGVSPGRTYTGPLWAGATPLNGATSFTLDQANAGIQGGDCTEYYTVRIFNGAGGLEDQELCFIDRVVAITPVSCDGCQIICAELVSTDSEETNPADDRGQAEACRSDERVDLSLTKTVNPTDGSNCGTGGMDTEFTFTITLTNEGDLTASDVQITDVFPEGMIVVSATSTNADAPLVTLSTIEWMVASLAPSASETLTIVGVFDRPGDFENCAMVTNVSPQNDPNDTNDMACTDVEVTGVNRPVITKSFSPAFARANVPVRLQIKLFNNEASPIELTEDLIDVLPSTPGQMTIASIPNLATILPGVVADPGATQLLVPSGAILQPGLTTLEVDVVVPTNGDYTNLILPDDLQTTACGNPDTARAELYISDDNVFGPILTKSFDVEQMTIGQTAMLTITVENRNPEAIVLAGDFSDIMPEGISVTGTPTSDCGGASTFGTSDRVGLMAGTTIAASSICTLQVEVTAVTAGIKCNQIPLNSVGVMVQNPGGPTMTSNEDFAEACLEVVNDPIFDLALRKTLAPMQSDTAAVGGSVSFLITVFNQGTETATDIQITDYVASGLNLIDDDNWNPDLPSGNAVLANAIPTLAAGADTSIVIQFNIDASFSGESITNTAEISSANGGTDRDSSPDNIPNNDKGGRVQSPSDDVILGNATLPSGAPQDENGLTDEDDADPAIVFLISNPCAIALDLSPGTCDPADENYTLSGSVIFNNAPATGELLISVDGTVAVRLSSFTSPQAFTVEDLLSDGASHTVTAYFTDAAACTITSTYTAPENCADAGACNVSLTAVPAECEPATSTFSISGEITFSDAPTTGTLVVNVGAFQLEFNPPFVSPLFYRLDGLPANGSTGTVSATFSDLLSCNGEASFQAPAACTPNECSLAATITTPTCVPATNRYDLTGQLTFSDAPTTGTLTVSADGQSQVFDVTDMSFASPLAYSLTGLISDGQPKELVAFFSDETSCRVEIDYTAPDDCSGGTPVCAADLSLSPSPCIEGEYTLAGTITLVDPPTTGTLTVLDGTNPLVSFAAPFSNAISFSFSGLEADGAMETLSLSFSADMTCTASASFMAPDDCMNEECSPFALIGDTECN
ncbi:MAG: hypothetical protein AAGF89_08660, partial [Bacteroidota bacterium]